MARPSACTQDFGINAFAVVADTQSQLVGFIRDLHLDTGGPGMPQGIG